MRNPIKWAQERLELRRAYKETFQTPHGQLVLAHILRTAGVTLPRFTTNIEQTRINEGERRLAVGIFNEVYSSETKLISQLQDEITKQEEDTS